jgi:sulfhydrogenase subunit gamma (sulfur reductase)
MKNPYVPLAVSLKKAFVESEDKMLRTFDFTFVSKEDEKNFKFMPGQFCQLSIPGKGEAPFGIASSPQENGFLRFTLNRAGVVTTALHHLEEGDEVGVRGPLGNYYPVERFEGKNIVIIGGGFAFTTLRSLVVYLLDLGNREKYKDITIIYGARAPGMLLYREEFDEWSKRDDLQVHVTVDKGDEAWKGLEGFVPTILGQVKPSPKDAYAVMCGPPAMIKFALPVLDQLQFKPEQIYTSLERRMKCGIGKCGRCNVGHLLVCKDGPVFSYDQLAGLPREY